MSDDPRAALSFLHSALKHLESSGFDRSMLLMLSERAEALSGRALTGGDSALAIALAAVARGTKAAESAVQFAATLPKLLQTLAEFDAPAVLPAPQAKALVADGRRNRLAIIGGKGTTAAVPHFKARRFEVQQYFSSDEALERILEWRPHWVLVEADLGGERGAGLALWSIVKRRMLDCACMAFTTQNDDHERIQAMRVGCIGYYVGPLEDGRLVEFFAARIAPERVRRDDWCVGVYGRRAPVAAGGVRWQPLGSAEAVLDGLRHGGLAALLIDGRDEPAEARVVWHSVRDAERAAELPVVLVEVPTDAIDDAALHRVRHPLRLPVVADADLAALVAARCVEYTQAQTQLRQAAQSDPLTGLRSRLPFLASLRERVMDPAADSVIVVLALLMNIQEAGDKGGLEGVDLFVLAGARRLHRELDPETSLARLGDALFAFEFRGPATTLHGWLSELRSRLAERAVQIASQVVTPNWVFVAGRIDPQAIDPSLVRIDRMLTQAAHGNRIIVDVDFASMTLTDEDRARTRRMILEAVERQRLTVVYQPIVALDGVGPQRYEMLLRVLDPSGSGLPPALVYQVVGGTRTARLLDRWVFGEGIRVARMHASRESNLVLHINLSAESLADQSFLTWVGECLINAELAPSAFVFEIGATELIDAGDGAERNVRAIKGLGLAVAVQNVESEPAHELLLARVQPQFVKPARNWIRDVIYPHRQNALARLSQSLRDMSAQVIAIGIDDTAQIRTLMGAGIMLAQGHAIEADLTTEQL